ENAKSDKALKALETENENLKTESEKLVEQNEQLNEKILRNMAEFENFKKRTQKEKIELSSYTKANCFNEVISAIDNFERALESPCKDEDYKKGMEMILSQLTSSLKAQSIEEIEAINQPFNPELHNAVSQIQDENLGENVVSSVMQKGYKIGDKIIRCAMVVVANP
ncbi:MAG: nucleotide exchange factor GrpE, partial [Oscillospiraceae bacterium]